MLKKFTLGKLFVYELRTTGRQYVPMYLVYIVLSIANMLFFEHGFMRILREEGLPDMFSMISFLIFCLYIICMIAVYVLTYVFMTMQFYRTTAGKQGYFTFSLPVRTSTILHSKLLAAIFWQLVSLAVVFLSIHTLCAFHGFPNLFSLMRTSLEAFSSGSTSLQQYLLFFAVAMTINLVISPLQFFTSIAIGQLFSKNRVAWSICFYFVIYTVEQILGSFLLFLQNFSSIVTKLSRNLITLEEYFQHMTSILFATLTLNLIIGIVLYGILQYVYTKKLNLT